MSINQKQFEQLTEMGISLWQRRSSDTSNDNQMLASLTFLDINLTELATKQLFTDIVLAAGLSVGEVKPKSDHLDLGLFNWFFTPEQSNNKLQWHDQQLFTPSIDIISQSSSLKRQLWQLLSKHHEQ
jgi:DNA polymerase III psi subunit